MKALRSIGPSVSVHRWQRRDNSEDLNFQHHQSEKFKSLKFDTKRWTKSKGLSTDCKKNENTMKTRGSGCACPCILNLTTVWRWTVLTSVTSRWGKETASNIEWKVVWVLDLVWTSRTKRKSSGPARPWNPTVKLLAVVSTKLLNIILHNTPCPKKIVPFFLFFFLCAQCVESGVSCTDCY